MAAVAVRITVARMEASSVLNWDMRHVQIYSLVRSRISIYRGRIAPIHTRVHPCGFTHIGPARSILSNALNLRRSAIAPFVRLAVELVEGKPGDVAARCPEQNFDQT